MERYKEIADREQLKLTPMCLDDMIPEDNIFRAINAIVENMNIRELGFAHSDTAVTGRKPYNPTDMYKKQQQICISQ